MRGCSVEERFWVKVDRRGDDECWPWLGFIEKKGYGRFVYPDGQLAHRYAYQLLVGPIPEGFTVDHVRARGCIRRDCVNPAHLEAVTGAENTRRGERATRPTCPAGHPYDVVKINPRTGWRNRRCSICDRAYFHDRYLREKAAA